MHNLPRTTTVDHETPRRSGETRVFTTYVIQQHCFPSSGAKHGPSAAHGGTEAPSPSLPPPARRLQPHDSQQPETIRMAALAMLQCLLALLVFTAALSPAAAGQRATVGRRMLDTQAPPLACPADFGGEALPANAEGACSGPSYKCPTSSCVTNDLGSNEE